MNAHAQNTLAMLKEAERKGIEGAAERIAEIESEQNNGGDGE